MAVDELEQVIHRAKREILDDIETGNVPASVGSFSELHDFVDANGYGGAFEEDAHCVDNVDFWNAVQNSVNKWLSDGRPTL
jgi:hypothetical protein